MYFPKVLQDGQCVYQPECRCVLDPLILGLDSDVISIPDDAGAVQMHDGSVQYPPGTVIYSQCNNW